MVSKRNCRSSLLLLPLATSAVPRPLVIPGRSTPRGLPTACVWRGITQAGTVRHLPSGQNTLTLPLTPTSNMKYLCRK